MLFFSFLFLYKLSRLNKVLLRKYNLNDLALLSYNNSQPLKYFGFSILLIGIGLCIIIWCFYCFRNDYLNILDLVSLLVCLFSVMFIIVLIIKGISVPILQKILTISCLAVGGIIVYSQKT